MNDLYKKRLNDILNDEKKTKMIKRLEEKICDIAKLESDYKLDNIDEENFKEHSLIILNKISNISKIYGYEEISSLEVIDKLFMSLYKMEILNNFNVLCDNKYQLINQSEPDIILNITVDDPEHLQLIKNKINEILIENIDIFELHFGLHFRKVI